MISLPPNPSADRARAIRSLGDDADASCPSCFSGYMTAFVVGGLISAVVILGIAPALRIHKEYRKES